MTSNDQTKTEWAIVELLGHKVTAGQVSEEIKFGKPMMRFDHPGSDSRPGFTQWINPDSIYCVTPTTEEIARAIAARNDPRPAVLFNLEYSLQRQLNAGTPGKPDDIFDDELDDY